MRKRPASIVVRHVKRPLPASSVNLTVKRVLGRGGFGVVQEMVWKQRDLAVAVKTYTPTNLDDVICFQQERHVLTHFPHPFMPQLYGVFSCADGSNHLMLQLCKGGDLLTALQRGVVRDDLFFYVVELVSIIAHLHEQHVLHGDIKLENVFIDDEGHVRLGDYGSSICGAEWNEGVSGFRGSMAYIAPEMFFQRTYGVATDLWALGCVLYELHVQEGAPPVDPAAMTSVATLLHMSPKVQQLDPLLFDLMRNLLEVNPVTRFTISDVLQHKLFEDVPWGKVKEKTWKLPPWVPSADYDGFDAEFTTMPTVKLVPTRVHLL